MMRSSDIQMLKKLDRYLLYVAIAALRRFFLILPSKISVKFAGFLGWTAFYVDRQGRETAVKNLHAAFPEKSEKEIEAICKAMYLNQGKNFAEFINFAKINAKDVLDNVRFEREDILKSAYAAGIGTILITAHFGNWELLGAAISAKKYPLSVIARPFYIEKVNEIVLDNRKKMGMEVIMRATEYAAREILKALKNNRIVGILIDQDTDVAGAFVKFFSKDAHTPVGPATIALKTRCSVIYAFMFRNPDDTHTAVFDGPVELVRTENEKNDIISNTQLFTSKIEEYVKRSPQSWVWFHKRWKTKKDAA